jgi:acetolactate synthase-1/2/3 large subunit
MALVKLSDYVVRRLPELTGSRHAFLLSGGGMLHLLDSLGRSEALTVVPMHHEQAAAIAADAYGRTGNTMGICLVTTGPGGTNAVTGVAGAFQESTPVLFISGQVSRANGRGELGIRQKGIQEVVMVPIVASITKYAVLIEDPDTIRFHLEKAVFLARSGRPGPVWLDIPLDVQNAMIEEDSLQGFDPGGLRLTENPAPAPEAILRIKALLAEARRPLLLLGGGIVTAGARALATALAEQLGIPVQTSWNGMDLLPQDHPLFYGRANLFGPRYPNFIIQNCDLLLAIGCRLGLQHTGYNLAGFAREAVKIMVDLDEAEMDKPGLNVTLKVKADAGATLEALLGATRELRLERPEWVAYCQGLRTRFPDAPALAEVAGQPYVDPYYFVDRLSALLPADCRVPFASSGMSHTITGGLFRVKAGQRVFTSKGLAAMGYALPSSVGACFAGNRGLTVLTVGDGGLMLNLQELQTIRHHRLPIKVFVFNNGGYHSIRMSQNGFFQGRYVGSTDGTGVSLPALEDLASVFGFGFARMALNGEVEDVVRQVLALPGPVLCEVMLDPDRALEPKVVSYMKADGTMESRPIEDMAPLLERELFRSLMLAAPIT